MILPAMLILMLPLSLLDNERLTVRMITLQPHSPAVPGDNALEGLTIYLDEGRLKFKNADRSVENRTVKRDR